jgi:glycosyltransferase involved in cell wall biosynthesis
MKFSVLISLYKDEKPEHVKKAFTSIWDNQTLKPNEIILVKDGPLGDALEAVIENFQRKLGGVLNVISLSQNLGLGAALNEGLKHCNYELIARMDADDISLPQRFEKQVSFMEKNPEIAVSSAWIKEFNDSDQTVSFRKLPSNHKAIKKFAKSRNPVSHPVAMFRKHAVLSVGGYPDFRKSQDYALWSLLLKEGYKFANLTTILLEMRAGSGLMNRRGLKYFVHEAKILKFQRDIGFTSFFEYSSNYVGRAFLRIAPNFFKKRIYSFFR